MTLPLLAIIVAHCFLVCDGISSSNLLRQNKLIDTVEVSAGSASKFWANSRNVEYYGDMVDVTKDLAQMISFRNFSEYFEKEFPVNGGDYEATYAVEHFFWGMKNGIVLELGAVDGVQMSQSLSMVKTLGWNRILIEGDPHHRTNLSTNHEALAYSCAICDSAQIVHFLEGERVGGIIEFMNEDFLKFFHRNISRVPKDQWSTVEQIKEIHCIPLSWILDHRHISHINFFILDVEGGELSVLRSIDYSRVRFDVISIETDFQVRRRRPVGFVNEVAALMSEHGYRFVRGYGRNSWFVHHLFTPSSKT